MYRDADGYDSGIRKSRYREDSLFGDYGSSYYRRTRDYRSRNGSGTDERLRTEVYRRRQEEGERRTGRSRRAQIRRRRRRRRRIRIAMVLGMYILLLAAAAAGIVGIGKGIQTIVHAFHNEESTGENLTEENAESTVIADDASQAEQTVQVVVDAGHGGNDQGTSHQNVLEKDINLAVALKVQNLLEKEGYTVLMTRDSDVKIDNYERAEMANEAKAQVFVSIHCNYLESGEADGIEIYYDSGKTEAGSLASRILKAMLAKTGARDRGVRTEDFIVTRETDMPSVLIELGYLNDSQERQNLASSSYQDKLAEGIVEGILSFLNG